MSAPLITMDHAKSHLRISHNDEDFDIELKIQQATDIVLDYLKDAGGSPDTWTVDTVPGPIQAAILLQLTELRRDRGDDDPQRTDALWRVPDGYLSPRVTRLLHRYRDPTLA